MAYFWELIFEALDDSAKLPQLKYFDFVESFNFDETFKGTSIEKYEYTPEEEDYLSEQESLDMSKSLLTPIVMDNAMEDPKFKKMLINLDQERTSMLCLMLKYLKVFLIKLQKQFASLSKGEGDVYEVMLTQQSCRMFPKLIFLVCRGNLDSSLIFRLTCWWFSPLLSQVK